MFGRLLPREVSFFDYFEQHIALVIEACKELLSLTDNGEEVAARCAHVKDMEHRADEVTHQCIDAIHRTFITPIDRAEILKLIKRLDDIIDSVDAAVMRIKLYEIRQMRPEAKEMAAVLVGATTEIAETLKLLRNLKNVSKINERCIKIYDFENQGDAILRNALVRLFKEETQPILVIKWKEIFEALEKASDRCEDVANIIQGVVVEAS